MGRLILPPLFDFPIQQKGRSISSRQERKASSLLRKTPRVYLLFFLLEDFFPPRSLAAGKPAFYERTDLDSKLSPKELFSIATNGTGEP